MKSREDIKKEVEKILFKEDIEKDRTAQELAQWCDEKQKLLHEKAGKFYQTCSASGLAKVFYEEVGPLRNFTQLINNLRPVEKCKSVIGGQNYDALVWFECDVKPTHIEFAQCTDIREEKLRLSKLAQDGVRSVSMLGPVKVSGTQNTGHQVKIDSIAVSVDEERIKIMNRIYDTALKKKRKNYPDRTIVVLVFEDYLMRGTNDNLEEYKHFYDFRIDPLNSCKKNFFLLSRNGKKLIGANA